MSLDVSAAAAFCYDGDRPPVSRHFQQGSLRVWNAEAIDTLTESVVTRLLVEAEEARAVAIDIAARLAVDQPHLPALALALPFTLAAAAIEEMLGAGPGARRAALDAWRVAALIGADTLALTAAGDSGPGTIAALWSRWRAGDEVFGPGPGDAAA